METKRLNKYIKLELTRLLLRGDIVVSLVGNQDLYTLSAKKVEYVGKQEKYTTIFEFRHNRDIDSVYIGSECVAQTTSRSQDIQELHNAMMFKKEQAEEARRIEFDRKNMGINDIRAMEFLKKYER